MKTRIFLAGMMAAALLSSCSQDEVVEALDMNQAIGFSTYVGTQTKGTVTDHSDDDDSKTSIKKTGFGVLASYTGQNPFVIEDSSTNPSTFTSPTSPNFMYNQLVSYSSVWTYSPLKYWPTTKEDKISFFAYAPYESAPYESALSEGTNKKGIVLSANNATGAPTITFTVNGDPTKMVDLVTDVRVDEIHNTSVDNSEVNFRFKHELTRVSFNAKVDERIALGNNTVSSPTRVVIKDVKLKGDANSTNVFYKSATYTFATTDGERGTWSYTNATLQSSKYPLSDVLNKVGLPANFLSDQKFIVDDDKYNSENTYQGIWLDPVATSATALFSDNQYLFLIPVPNVGEKLIAEITYDIITADANLEKGYSFTRAVKEVTLPLVDATDPTKECFSQGQSNVFTFIIGIDEIKVSAEVGGWNDMNNNTNVEYGNTDVNS